MFHTAKLLYKLTSFSLSLYVCVYKWQYGMGLLHLLHGCFSHHAQLLHKDGDWVQTQAKTLRAGPSGRADLPGPRGFPLFPWQVSPVHLQLHRRLPEPHEQSWKNAVPACTGGSGRQHRLSGRRTMLRDTSGVAQAALLWPKSSLLETLRCRG